MLRLNQIKQFNIVGGVDRLPGVAEDGKVLQWDNTSEYFIYSDIATGDVNVQSDWDVANISSDAYIKNKPTIPTTLIELGGTSDDIIEGIVNLFISVADQGKLDGIEAFAQLNVQSDWDQTDSGADDYIKNKPTIPTDLSDLTGTLDDITEGALNKHFTSTYKSNVDLNTAARHTHSNKTELDLITDAGSGLIVTDAERILWNSYVGAGTEFIQDTVAAFIQDGTGLNWTYDDTGNTLTGDVDMSVFTTTDLAEGINLYYTDTRVREALSASNVAGFGTLEYDNTTGEFEYTGVSSDEVRSLISATGSPVAYDPVTGIISWTGGTIVGSPLTTKGDLYTYSTLDTRLAVGTDGQILTADSSEPTGIKWEDVPTSTVTSVSSLTTDQITVANGTTTPQLSIVTAAVIDTGTALATGDQIYDFVTGLGYTTYDTSDFTIDFAASDLADLATKSHTSLTDIGSNTHAQIDTHIGAVNPHSGSAASGANSDITSLTGLTTPLGEIYGGTGLASYVIGDILYANSTTTLNTLSIDTDGKILTLSGGLPSWESLDTSGDWVGTFDGQEGTYYLDYTNFTNAPDLTTYVTAASTFTVDNRLLKSDGGGTRGAQPSGITVDDSDNVEGIRTLEAETTNGVALKGTATTGFGIVGISDGTNAAIQASISKNDSSGVTLIDLSRSSSSSAPGIGAYIDYTLWNDTNFPELSGRVSTVLTNATSGSETSSMGFWTVSSGGSLTETMTLGGAGTLSVDGLIGSGNRVLYTSSSGEITPLSDGASAQVLTTNGSGVLTWEDPAASGIGGSGSTGYIPKFTASDTIGNSIIQDQGVQILINGDIRGDIYTSVGSTSGITGWRAPAIADNTIYTFPSVAGTSGQVLSTDGSDNLVWIPAPGGGNVNAVNSPLANEYAKWTGGTTIEGLTVSEVRTDLSINLVENTALSTWAGSSNLITLGNVTTGVWTSDNISLAYGGTGASLTDPNADKILYWDDTSNEVTWLTVGTNLTITGGVLNATAGAGGYTEIQEEGVGLTARSKMNFIGSGITATDDAGNVRTNITLNSNLNDISQLTPTDSNFIVGNGSNWIVESGGTARTSIGLGNVEDTALSTWAGSSNITTLGTITTGVWNGSNIGLADGGTGSTLTDPNDDRILYWNDISGAVEWLDLGTGLSITSNVLNTSVYNSWELRTNGAFSQDIISEDYIDLEATKSVDITYNGSGNRVIFELENDEFSPGTDKVYGTNSIGVKGWYDAAGGGSGSVTLVGSGNGMNFSSITTTGTVTLGTPSTITGSSTNSTTSSSHTHAVIVLGVPKVTVPVVVIQPAQ